ncbi:MAG: ferritin family protein [Candidatus Aminicenantes bacterium]|nr:ferritin family protein [Candidatus Aminicenantes bacterium]
MNMTSFESVVKSAIAREEAAIKTYGSLAQRAKSPGLKKMLLELQDEEKAHKKLLENIDDAKIQDLVIKDVPDLKISDYLTDEPPAEDMTIQDLLILAAKKEQEAVMLYTNLADNAKDQELKKLFQFLIQQEKSHKLMLEKEYDEHVLEQD